MVTGVLLYSKRKPREYFHYKGEIFADQAGYYVYLPGAFIYRFDGSSFTEELMQGVGYGFSVDTISGKIETKYAIGVALLQSPFFVFTHLYNKWSGGPTDGFSGSYHNVPNWASWVYVSLGLWFFYLFLYKRIKYSLALLFLTVIFFGSSLYYYSMDNSGMSHVYSFFLFSLFLYCFDITCTRGNSVKRSVILGMLAGLIVAVRPVNVLFIGIAVPYLMMLHKRDLTWMKRQLSIPNVFSIVGMGFLMIVPQLLYWKYVHGEWIYYSYGSEGFSNWNDPQLLPFFFAPKAGLFTYSPAYLLAILAIVFGIKKRENGWLLFGFFGFCYLMSAWHIYFFGCSFGSRNLVEYAPLFFIPLALQLNSGNKYLKRTTGTVLIVASTFTISLSSSYSGCFYGNTWDWREYREMALRGTYYTSIGGRHVDEDELYSGINSSAHQWFTCAGYSTADVKIKVEGYSEDTELVFEMYKDSIVEYASFNVMEEIQKDGGDAAYYSFLIGRGRSSDAIYKFYIYNEGKDDLDIEKLAVWLH